MAVIKVIIIPVKKSEPFKVYESKYVKTKNYHIFYEIYILKHAVALGWELA